MLIESLCLGLAMSETIEKSLIESEGISLMTKIPRLLCISDSLIKLYESRLVA